MNKIVTVLVLLTLLFIDCELARILAVFPEPLISHQMAYRPVTHELAKRGHEVVVINPNPEFSNNNTIKNLREIDLHDLSYKLKNDLVEMKLCKKTDHLSQIIYAYKILPIIVEQQFKSKEVQNLVKHKNETFDLLLTSLYTQTALGYFHFFNAPIIQFSSLGGVRKTFENIGAPNHPHLYPSAIRNRINNITFWEKVLELYNFFVFRVAMNDIDANDEEMLKKLDPNISNLQTFITNAQVIFLNSHTLWDFNRPVPINAIRIPRIHQTSNQVLTKDLKLFIDESVNGVVYVSLGSSFQPSFSPPEKIKILIDAFSQLPYNILLKWDKENLPGLPKNIKTAKWFPQSTLLKLSNIKAFVTQAGLHSTDEAIDAGVPLVALPTLSDQWFNSELYEYYKIGIKLDFETLTSSNLKNAIETVVKDTSYKKNIIKLRSIMRDQPYPSLELAVMWTEYILKYGSKHLTAPAAGLKFFDYYEIELVTMFLLSLTALLSLIIYINYFIVLKIYKTCYKYKKDKPMYLMK